MEQQRLLGITSKELVAWNNLLLQVHKELKVLKRRKKDTIRNNIGNYI